VLRGVDALVLLMLMQQCSLQDVCEWAFIRSLFDVVVVVVIHVVHFLCLDLSIDRLV